MNLQSQVVINQKFEKDISVSIYHCQQRVLFELSLYSEVVTGGVYRKIALKNLAIFTEKHLCWSQFLIGFRVETLLKSDPNRGVFCEYCQSFKNTYFEKHLQTTAASVYCI